MACRVIATFPRVIVDMMGAGYVERSLTRALATVIEQKNYLLEVRRRWPRASNSASQWYGCCFQVWVTFQDNVLHYLSNAMLLPLVIRSNRTISRYFVSYESTASSLTLEGSQDIKSMEKVKVGM